MKQPHTTKMPSLRVLRDLLPSPLAAWSIYAACVVATGLAMVGRLAAYDRISGVPILVATLLAIALVILAIPFVLDSILRWADWLALPAAAAIVLMMTVVAPRYKLQSSSDQGDCIIVAAGRLADGMWPYDAASLWSQNPLSCGPGWVLLHMPFLAVVSYPMAMLLVIGASIAAIFVYAGQRRAARFLVLLALVPGFWQGLGNRVDFPTFALVLAAVAAIWQARPAARWTVRALTAPIVLLLSHFRFPFLFIPAVIFVRPGRTAFLFGAVVQLLSVALWSAFYLYNDEAFIREGPMHVVGKITSVISPQNALLLMVAGVFPLLVLLRRIQYHTTSDHLLLLYLAAVIFPISLQNLFAGADQYASVLPMLQNWEGLSWLTGSACFAAWVLSAEQQPARRDLYGARTQIRR